MGTGQTRQSYLETYRNDWRGTTRAACWKTASSTLYIPALYETGNIRRTWGVSSIVPLSHWYRPFERVLLKRLSRTTRWSLYAEERINTMAFIGSLREALSQDMSICCTSRNTERKVRPCRRRR